MKSNGETKLFEELEYRESNGIEVSLLWNVVGQRASVLVVDTRSTEVFELTVGSEQALEVFHHPYAYAASRGIEFAPSRSVGEVAAA